MIMQEKTAEVESFDLGPRALRVQDDVESFLKFVNGNDLRKEAKMIFEEIWDHIGKSKRGRKKKTRKTSAKKVLH
jgi:hypothetical protein